MLEEKIIHTLLTIFPQQATGQHGTISQRQFDDWRKSLPAREQDGVSFVSRTAMQAELKKMSSEEELLNATSRIIDCGEGPAGGSRGEADVFAAEQLASMIMEWQTKRGGARAGAQGVEESGDRSGGYNDIGENPDDSDEFLEARERVAGGVFAESKDEGAVGTLSMDE